MEEFNACLTMDGRISLAGLNSKKGSLVAEAIFKLVIRII